MLTIKQAEEILRALSELPPDKVAEAQDFILFLKERYKSGQSVDESDFWTEEDLQDLIASVMDHAEETLER